MRGLASGERRERREKRGEEKRKKRRKEKEEKRKRRREKERNGNNCITTTCEFTSMESWGVRPRAAYTLKIMKLS